MDVVYTGPWMWCILGHGCDVYWAMDVMYTGHGCDVYWAMDVVYTGPWM